MHPQSPEVPRSSLSPARILDFDQKLELARACGSPKKSLRGRKVLDRKCLVDRLELGLSDVGL